MKLSKRNGFSLSEILIALGIVGIVASMMLPTLMSNYNKKVYVSQLQKVYNTLDNALQQLQVEEDGMDLGLTSLNPNKDADGIKKLFRDRLKTVNTCTAGNLANCIGTGYKGMKGDAKAFPTDADCAILKSGQTLCIKAQAPDAEGKMLDVYIDVNGPKRPNIYGRDTFILKVNKTGNIAEYFDVASSSYSPSQCTDSTYGDGCFTRIMSKSWEMDY